MATNGKKKWLYRKNGRYYADFRSYSDVGGGQEAMIPEGERFAATWRAPSPTVPTSTAW